MALYRVEENPKLEPGEIVGRLVVVRGGGALVVDDRGKAVLAVEAGDFLDSGAMHGDTVVARRSKKRGAAAANRAVPSAAAERAVSLPAADRDAPPPGHVTRILRRGNPTVVGTLERQGRSEWVTPADRRLPRVLIGKGSLGASPGERVVVAISTYPTLYRPDPIGAVVERLGAAGDPDAETLAIIRELGLRDSFPAKVLAEAEDLPREVAASECAGRLDLRAETVFTIDDEDARDLDDAISLSAGPKGTRRLGVHIADVAHYVPAGSALDTEARERGTSVYLVDRVLPMFPTRLSNGIASLHPGVDRLTLSVLMDVDESGRVTSCEVWRSVIRSVARLTYEAVAAFLDPAGSRSSAAGAANFLPPESPARAVLPAMASLAADLRRRRMARGSLDFDLVEEKMKLDGDGRPLAVLRRQRNIATQLIEEFMIAANEAVADYLLWSGVPFMARVHEEPFPDDLAALRDQLAPLGYHVPTTRSPRPADLQAILEAARSTPQKDAVHAALLRALPRARYSAARLPHFALASSNYTHFTSPIRRYPDLTVHRQVARVLEGAVDRDPAELENLTSYLAATADACSRAERAADKAEEESLRLKKTELAKRFLGQVGEGAVVDVFDFGAFVRLPNGVEGLVPASALDGRLRPALRLGDKVTVQIVRADLAKRQVDMALAD